MKIIEEGDYVHIKSKGILLTNGKLDMFGLVSFTGDVSFSFRPTENMEKYYSRSDNCDHTDIIAIYTYKEMIQLYPEIMI
jgi:hypothetical protein